MPREAPVTRAMREARGRGIGRGSLHGRPCLGRIALRRRDPYAVKVMMADGACSYGVRKNEGRWLWVPAFAGTTLEPPQLASASSDNCRGCGSTWVWSVRWVG